MIYIDIFIYLSWLPHHVPSAYLYTYIMNYGFKLS